MASKNLCPCTSGLAYRACCAPYHRGEIEPPDCDALVRSRFSAFALHDAPYLWKTLDPEHEDRALVKTQGMSEADMLRRIKINAVALRYMRLRLFDRSGPDADGIARVLFYAGIYEKGRELSFIELSRFRHDGAGWRYLAGELRPATGLRDPIPEGISIAAFERGESPWLGKSSH